MICMLKCTGVKCADNLQLSLQYIKNENNNMNSQRRTAVNILKVNYRNQVVGIWIFSCTILYFSTCLKSFIIKCNRGQIYKKIKASIQRRVTWVARGQETEETWLCLAQERKHLGKETSFTMHTSEYITFFSNKRQNRRL